MNLSIVCVTNNQYNAKPFILRLHSLCTRLGAELVLGLDREKAQKADWRSLANVTVDLSCDKLQEDELDKAIEAATRDWVLRIDDDETVSPALESWLFTLGHEKSGYQLYAFPRIHLYPDAWHYVSNPEMLPDLQTRLGKKPLMFGVNRVHAGNPNGTGAVVPYALEHHKLICRTLEQRKEIAARYETLMPGAGTRMDYARSNWPEQHIVLETREYKNNGNFSAH